MARPAELDGIQLPATVQANGTTLHLNGYGLRTYSLLGIHIYVAALYLEHPSTDAEQIIGCPETKLLVVRFERNVSAEAARKAWREGLENNCQSPCTLDPDDVARFLSEMPAMHAGDNYSLLFTPHGGDRLGQRTTDRRGLPARVRRCDAGYVPWPASGLAEAETRTAA